MKIIWICMMLCLPITASAHDGCGPHNITAAPHNGNVGLQDGGLNNQTIIRDPKSALKTKICFLF